MSNKNRLISAAAAKRIMDDCVLWETDEVEIAKTCIDLTPSVDADCVFVAPCKMGEPIYIVITKIPKPGFPDFTFIRKSRLTECNFFRVLRGIGKTIFLTREEAAAKKEEIERGQRTEV